MTPERWRRLEEVFSGAMERGGLERTAFVRTACAGDGELQGQVEDLLRHHEHSTAFLESPPPGANGCPEPMGLPDRIGTFRIVRPIASGGMGSVYEAEQDQPRRTVALKVARSALVSPWSLRRFRHEADILARLRHPAIAQVYEAGAYAPAPGLPPVPFFAMEFVEGARPLTVFAREQALSLEATLRLFIQVCEAVHHGNRLGIVHRDLKPANILVDRSGRPKVIDFGLARAIDPDSATITVDTEPGQIIGTLAYMSPEHLGGHPHDVDTRSDVYALGVVLYELLCGRLPHDVHDKALGEAARLIQCEPPARPSAAARHIRGELETIVLKALEKEPDRRYQSAADLARDLERHLRHEPIEARPPTAIYRVRKFVRRRWALVGGATVATVALVAGTGVSTGFAIRESRAARIAQEAGMLLDQVLASADPSVAEPELKVRELLDRTAADIDARAGSLRPEVEAAVRSRLGRSYLGLGAYREARRQFEASIAAAERAGAADTAEFLSTLTLLSRAARQTPDPESGLGFAERALPLASALAGRQSEQYAAALVARASPLVMLKRYDEAVADAQESLRIREALNGPQNPALAESISILAAIAHFQRRPAEAEALMARAVELCRLDAGSAAGEMRLASSLGNLGITVMRRGRLDDAEKLHREAVEILSRRLRPENPTLYIARKRLAVVLEQKQALAEAEGLYRQILDGLRRGKETDPMTLALAHDDLASTLVRLKRPAEAAPLLSESIRIRREHLPAYRPDAAGSLEMLAGALLATGRPDDARDAAAEAMELRDAESGPADPRTLAARSLLGECLLAAGRAAEAAPHLMESYAALTKAVGEGDQRTVEAARRLELLRSGHAAPAPPARDP